MPAQAAGRAASCYNNLGPDFGRSRLTSFVGPALMEPNTVGLEMEVLSVKQNPARRHVVAVLLVFGLFLMGCGPLGGWSLAPRPPDRPLAISEEAAERLVQRWTAAWQEAGQTGQVQIRIAEDELTSFLNLRLAKDEKLPMSEPRIWFNPDGIYMEGRLTLDQLSWRPRVLLVFTAQVEDGKLQIDLIKGALGSLPLPTAILSPLDDGVDAFLANARTNFSIRSITLEEGVLTVTLSRQPS